MGIHLRIYKDSPNSTEFQGMNRTSPPFFDPKKGVPSPAVRPQSGSDGTGIVRSEASLMDLGHDLGLSALGQGNATILSPWAALARRPPVQLVLLKSGKFQ